jgi:hypothetical protein
MVKIRHLLLVFALPLASAPPAAAADLALNKPASASSTEDNRADLRPALANDGNSNSRWSSAYSVPQWWQVDLGSRQTINRVELNWEVASRYQIQTRNGSGQRWLTAVTASSASAGLKVHTFAARTARFVRVYVHEKRTPRGVSLWDARMCNEDSCDTPSPPPTGGGAKPIGFWALNYGEIRNYTDAVLDELRYERGVGMLVLETRHLCRLGGNCFTTDLTDPRVQPSGTDPKYRIQRDLMDTDLIERANARGMEVWFGHYAVARDPAGVIDTPYSNWEDETAWQNNVLPSLRELATGCRVLGCKGITNDSEEYPDGSGSLSHTWKYTYPGAPDRATLDSLVYRRGQQYMDALNVGFPGVRQAIYYARFPGSYEESARTSHHNQPTDYFQQLDHRFWLGATSATIAGNTIDKWDSWFYKRTNCAYPRCWQNDGDIRTPGVQPTMPPGTQNTMHDTVAEAVKRHYDFLRPRVTTARLARWHYSNFTWIPAGPRRDSTSDDAQSPEFVETQLRAARDVGTAPHIPVYGGPVWDEFNWTPYEPAMLRVASGG